MSVISSVFSLHHPLKCVTLMIRECSSPSFLKLSFWNHLKRSSQLVNLPSVLMGTGFAYESSRLLPGEVLLWAEHPKLVDLWRVFCTCHCFFSSSLQLFCLLPITLLIINYNACTYQILLVTLYLVLFCLFFVFLNFLTCFVVLLFHNYICQSNRCGMKSGSVHCFICFSFFNKNAPDL